MSRCTRQLHLSLLLLLALTPSVSRATPAGDVILGNILAENIVQTVNAANTLTTLQQNLMQARQYVQIARDTYAGVQALSTADLDGVLNASRTYFMNATGANSATGLVEDVRSNRLNGGTINTGWVNAQLADARLQSRCYAQLDELNNGARRMLDADCRYMLDTRAASRFSQGTEDALRDTTLCNVGLERIPCRLVTAQPTIASSTAGIVDARLGSEDPALLAELLRQRSIARSAAVDAMRLYFQSLGASPGKAQQLAAQSAALGAAQLAAIAEGQSQLVAMEQRREADAANRAAAAAARDERLQRQLGDAIDRGFHRTDPGEAPSMSDR
jgi:hypothetical protein